MLLQLMARFARDKNVKLDEVDTDHNGLAIPVYITRQTTAPFLDTPEEPPETPEEQRSGSWFRGTIEALSPTPADPLKLPERHTIYCMSPKLYKATALLLQVVFCVTSLVEGVYILEHENSVGQYLSGDPGYIGSVLIFEAVVWAWCTFVLSLAPASSSCSVPIFWVRCYKG